MPGGLAVDVLLTGADTDGALCLFTDHPPAGWGLPPHHHEREAETVYVVAGRFVSVVGGEARELGPGEAVHIPAGVVHSIRLVGEEPGERVVLFTPAGMERFFRAAGSAEPGGEADAAALVRLAREHGWRFA